MAALDTRIVAISSEEGLTASFAPDAGMVCCSLTDHGEQMLGLRGGLEAYARQRSTMGIPLLYPWANRLSDSAFAVAGWPVDLRESDPAPKLDPNGLPIHGLLAAATGWEVTSTTDVAGGQAIEANFQFGGALAAGFPFPHSIALAASLIGTELTIELTVHADADSEVPIAFGFHPYLTLPDVARDRWRLSIPVGTGLELDDLGLPTGQRVPVEPIEGELGGRTFDDAFLAPDDAEPFLLSGGGRRIEVRFLQGFPFAQLYAPPGEDLLAWEPMTAPTNALVSGDDLTVIAPGESYRAAFSIRVEDAQP